MATEDYNKFLREELQDPEVAAEYLSAALEDGSIDQFLLALKNVADSHGGIGVLAGITELNRQNMYKTLSEDGNPTLHSLLLILGALGMRLACEPRENEAA